MTAWDWYFSQQKPAWVIVTLKNGSQVYGLFDEQSHASSDPECRDLYLEATFQLVSTGEWAPSPDTAGILICADQIAHVEFRKI